MPKLPDLAMNVAKVAVSGFWLTEAMRSIFIAADGPILVVDAHTGAVTNMTAQPASLSATIVAAQTLAFWHSRTSGRCVTVGEAALIHRRAGISWRM